MAPSFRTVKVLADDVTPIPTFDHDPDANLNYAVDWTDWLPSGESIGTSSWSADTGAVIGADTNEFDKPEVFITLDSVTMNVRYLVTNHIVSSPSGLEEDQSFRLKALEK